jgi:CheY-like chemotaxis protein
LGLWISKAIVEEHGGKIYATSEGHGKGSVFTVELSVFRKSDKTATAPVPDALTRVRSQSSSPVDVLQYFKRVLVVDDAPLNRKLLARILRNAGCEVKEAYDGQNCLDMLVEESFDLVMMDYEMPVMNGPTAVKAIRDRGMHDILVLGATGNCLPEDIQYFISQGANDVLTKPLSLEKVVGVVTKLTDELKTDNAGVSPPVHKGKNGMVSISTQDITCEKI